MRASSAPQEVLSVKVWDNRPDADYLADLPGLVVWPQVNTYLADALHAGLPPVAALKEWQTRSEALLTVAAEAPLSLFLAVGDIACLDEAHLRDVLSHELGATVRLDMSSCQSVLPGSRALRDLLAVFAAAETGQNAEIEELSGALAAASILRPPEEVVPREMAVRHAVEALRREIAEKDEKLLRQDLENRNLTETIAQQTFKVFTDRWDALSVREVEMLKRERNDYQQRAVRRLAALHRADEALEALRGARKKQEARVEQLLAEVEMLQNAVAQQDKRIVGKEAALKTQRERLAATNDQLAALQASTSWRITAPLRMLSLRMRHLLKH
ncbi:hypothetical protein [Oceanicola granulosus]|uniref:hypothetical protein n=1 Tax=Oceanicola granulosus TaxID=252302 RepID=UPI0012E99480|nr:hypothetical protein [Oceanicola granulosus]